MPRKAPNFWRQGGLLATLLTPLSCLYYAGHKIKWASSKPYKSTIPVICVGGIVAGGSGKTPTLHALLSLIHENNLYQKPVILLRGYGGNLKGPLIVDPQKHSYRDVGDEALLHAALTTTIVSADRAAGAKLAEEFGADIILMDDGLQNNTLVKDISFLVLNGAQSLGNGKMLPAGPLREPLTDALPRVDAIIQIGGGTIIEGRPTLHAAIKPLSIPDKTIPYFGFAGIGDPYKFKETLLSLGLSVEGFLPFADHHPYNEADMQCLKAMATHRTLITTAKDFVRIPSALRAGIIVVPIELIFENPSDVRALLNGAAS